MDEKGKTKEGGEGGDEVRSLCIERKRETRRRKRRRERWRRKSRRRRRRRRWRCCKTIYKRRVFF